MCILLLSTVLKVRAAQLSPWGGVLLVTLLALLSLFVLAIASLIRQEARISTLQRRSERLAAMLGVTARDYLQRSPTDLLQSLAEAACSMVTAASVTGYVRDTDVSGGLKRVTLSPRAAALKGPANLAAPIPGSGIRPVNLPGIGIGLWAPVVVDGVEIAGLLLSFAALPHLGDEDWEILTLLMIQAAAIFQNMRLYGRVLAQASSDGLTGLLTHRAFQVRLEEEVVRARRGGHMLSLIMIDLDNFRTINNTYGHPSGDATLAALANALRESIRAGDVPARYGGDEFAVILPETAMADALVVAERVLAAITALRVLEDDGSVRIGASIGVATVPIHATTRAELIRTADQAQYAAKHAGKGRIGTPDDVPLTFDDDPEGLALQLEHANLATIEALAAAVDAKDPFTRGHSQRVSAYATALAGAMNLALTDVLRVQLAGLLHDVGKIGVPDAVLCKPSELTAEELHLVQQHTVIGEQMLDAVPFLRGILPAVRHHHE
ncbi:MAG TPA: diguanylate cyclase, partial [Chloroflexota bacterium]|nr:diguanylate cyclase [Chloroflexota bacterium]